MSRRESRAIKLLAATLLFATPLAAQASDPVVAAEPALGDPLPDRVISLADGVTVLADVTYSSLPGFRPLILDLYRGKEQRAAQPLVVYIHGGGWRGGHTRQSGAFSDFPAVLARLASRGYVVASVEYRLSGEAPFPAAIDDVRAAIRFLRANAARYAIDPSKIAVWGGSAGGQLTALAALSCGAVEPKPGDAPSADTSDCVQGGVGWYGIYDFASLRGLGSPQADEAPPERVYLGCPASACPAAQIAAASPISFVDKADPPMLLIHGAQDKVVPVEQSQLLSERLRQAGAPVQLSVIPNVGHSWVGADAAATRQASLRALNETFAFFDTLFGTRR